MQETLRDRAWFTGKPQRSIVVYFRGPLQYSGRPRKSNEVYIKTTEVAFSIQEVFTTDLCYTGRLLWSTYNSGRLHKSTVANRKTS